MKSKNILFDYLREENKKSIGVKWKVMQIEREN